MSDGIDRVRIYPRYTTLIGTAHVYTAPIGVRAYANAIFTAWQGTGLGTTPATLEYTIQESVDLENWTDIGTLSPDAGMEKSITVNFGFAWIRVKSAVTGDDPGVMTWLLGEFVRRDSTMGAA